MKIGVFGGSFNPITNGHLQVIRVALNYFDRVLVAPAPIQYKREKLLSSNRHRMNMCRLAIRDLSRVEISDYQMVNPSYHYDAWCKMVKHYPNREFYFIIGTDVANTVPFWDHYPQIMTEIKFAVVTRKDYTNKLEWKAPHLTIDADIESISSTTWRERYDRNEKEHQNMNFPTPQSS